MVVRGAVLLPPRDRSIEALLAAWDAEPGYGLIRFITGQDQREKVQIRIELGLLQMELAGRPDGQRPYGYESLLDYHTQRLADYEARFGSSDGFRLAASECEALVAEATQYYQRYSVLQQVGRVDHVARDAARNLSVADLLEAHAAAPEHAWPMVRYRGYILTVHALAQSAIHRANFDHAAAEKVLATAMAAIRQFGGAHLGKVDVADELSALSDQLREIQSDRPRDEFELLERRLEQAIAVEDYESAAALRDELRLLAGPAPDIELP